MTPDVDLQLQAVIKSLKDNVLPLISESNQLAHQQMSLSLATLGMIRERLPLLHAMARREMMEFRALLSGLLPLLGDVRLNDKPATDELEGLLNESKKALEDPALGCRELNHHTKAIRNAIGRLISENEHAAVAKDLERMILESSQGIYQLGRSVNKPMGFEPNPEDVTSLDVMLSAIK